MVMLIRGFQETISPLMSSNKTNNSERSNLTWRMSLNLEELQQQYLMKNIQAVTKLVGIVAFWLVNACNIK